MGAQAAPQAVKRAGPGAWRYRAGLLGEMFVTERVIAGGAGTAALWHACTLHAARPEVADRPIFSLRWRAARGAARSCGIDAVNRSLAGPLVLAANA
jgi:hypothetical protein